MDRLDVDHLESLQMDEEEGLVLAPSPKEDIPPATPIPTWPAEWSPHSLDMTSNFWM